MSPELLALLERARNHIMTPAEVYEQRVSWIIGMSDFDKELPSREQIEAALLQMGIVKP